MEAVVAAVEVKAVVEVALTGVHTEANLIEVVVEAESEEAALFYR